MFNLMGKYGHRQHEHTEGGIGWCRRELCECFGFQEEES